MPKKSFGARSQRQRDRQVAANPHRQRTRPQKVGYTDAYRRQRLWRMAGAALMGIGVLMALGHIIEHLGRLQVLPTTGLQDLLIGFPMAGLMFLGGVLPASRRA